MSAFFFFGASGVIKTKFFLLYTPKKVKLDIWSVIFCYENFFGFQSMVPTIYKYICIIAILVYQCVWNFTSILKLSFIMYFQFFLASHTFYTDIQLYAIACIFLIAVNSMKHKMRIFLSTVLVTLLCRSLVLYFLPDTKGFIVMGLSWVSFHFYYYFIKCKLNLKIYIYIICKSINLSIKMFRIDEFERMFHVMYGTPFGRLPIYLTGIAIGYYIRHNVGKYSNLPSVSTLK